MAAVFESFSVPPLGCNCSIVGDAGGSGVVVDPGGDVGVILAKLTEHNMTCGKILITHGHLDHILAADELRAATGAPVVMHADDLKLWETVQRQCRDFGVPPPAKPLDPVDAHAAHNEVIAVGDTLKCRCLHVPGHTAGSVAWLVEGAGVARCCVGDTLFENSVGRTSWRGCEALDNKSNANQLVSSIKSTLWDLPDDTYVVCGHGGSTTIGKEKATNPIVGAGRRPGHFW
jgi:glyoxylase-like metal-dependent hydrolase (beta-lactamase superfamily II)